MEIIIPGALINILFANRFLGHASKPVLLIHTWWFGWLIVAYFSFTGLFAPSNFTILLCTLLMSSLTLGAWICRFTMSNLNAYPRYLLGVPDDIVSRRAESLMMRILTFGIAPFVIFFSMKAFWILLRDPHIASYRARAFGIGVEYPILFKYEIVNSVNMFIIEPMILASLFIGVALFVQYRRRRVLVLGITLTLLHTTMMLGRFGIHYIAVMLGLILLFQGSDSLRQIFKRPWITAVFLSSLVLISAFITLIRANEKKNHLDLIGKYLIDYHTVSFSILDKELRDPKSLIHDTTYGRSSLGSFERLAIRGLRFIGVDKISQVDLNGLALMSNREVGRDNSGNGKYYNAFGSVLFSLYRDGKILFLCMAGFVFGFLISYFSLATAFRNVGAMAFLTGLIFIGIYGIFQSVIEGPVYLAILFIFLIQRRAIHHNA